MPRFREVATTVMFGYEAPSGIKIMLLHRWPNSIYVDPYQLESLRGQSDWQVRDLCVFEKRHHQQ